jgi:hypothetical protein
MIISTRVDRPFERGPRRNRFRGRTTFALGF